MTANSLLSQIQVHALLMNGRPENLLFCTLEQLEDELESWGKGVKASVAAELLVRCFLSGDAASPEAALLDSLLSHGEREQFMAAFPGPHFYLRELQSALWQSEDDFSQCCQAAVRSRFMLLFRADGLIPVYLTAGRRSAYAVPFHFDCQGDSAHVMVRDLDGMALPEWSGYLRQLGVPQDVVVHCHCSDLPRLTGPSLMLPLQMAWWRHTDDLPKYNVFRFLATGAFDAELRLASVETTAKMEGLTAQIQDFRLICPESVNGVKPSRNVTLLPTGTSRDNLLPYVRRLAEELSWMELPYARKRLGAMVDEVNITNCAQWAAVEKRLENAAVFDPDGHPEGYLTNLMLRSEAWCHAGQTAVAKELNGRARRFALKQGSAAVHQLLRLEIDSMVLLQDEEKFGEAVELGNELKPQLESVSEDDLWMRWHGTMGQAVAYGTLDGLPDFQADKALEYFRQAVHYACRLGSEIELAHDRNYLHLWYALFAPGSPGEREAFEQARAVVRRLENTNPEAVDRNLWYLKRSQALAWYRRLLQEGAVPEFRIDGDFERLLLPAPERGAEDWLRACVGKYLGALEAASGRRQEAEKRFIAAVKAIEPETHPGVKSLIRLTVYAEAYRSLKDARFLEGGRRLLQDIRDCRACRTFDRWAHFLKNPASPFPGMDYWY